MKINQLTTFNQMTVDNSDLTMTSREIAVLCGKEHRHVKNDIVKLEESYVQLSLPKIRRSFYIGENGQEYEQYELTKEQSIDLVTGYSRELRIMINRRWLELENQTKTLTPTTLLEALELAVQLEKEKALITQQLSHEKELAKLENGKSVYGASINQVKLKTNKTYNWYPLQRWCDENGIIPDRVCLNGYNTITVATYPNQAWLDIYNIDLNKLF